MSVCKRKRDTVRLIRSSPIAVVSGPASGGAEDPRVRRVVGGEDGRDGEAAEEMKWNEMVDSVWFGAQREGDGAGEFVCLWVQQLATCWAGLGCSQGGSGGCIIIISLSTQGANLYCMVSV